MHPYGLSLQDAANKKDLLCRSGSFLVSVMASLLMLHIHTIDCGYHHNMFLFL